MAIVGITEADGFTKLDALARLDDEFTASARL